MLPLQNIAMRMIRIDKVDGSPPPLRPGGSGGLRTQYGFVVSALLSSLLTGCLNPNFTRYPSLMTSFPKAENSAYQRQDPFPDPDIGPSTMATPRGYERPRSQARQAAEQRLLQGLPVGPENVPAGVPQGGLSRPQAVR